MALNQYCELDEVRAALGVNSVELPDTVLNLPIYEMSLVRELAKVSASLPGAFLGILAIAEESRTSAQREVFVTSRIFSVYTCAKQVGVSLASMTPKEVGDGVATLTRFSGDPYKDVMSRVEAAAGNARSDLQAAYAVLAGSSAAVSSTIPMTFAKADKRGYDPVTGA